MVWAYPDFNFLSEVDFVLNTDTLPKLSTFQFRHPLIPRQLIYFLFYQFSSYLDYSVSFFYHFCQNVETFLLHQTHISLNSFFNYFSVFSSPLSFLTLTLSLSFLLCHPSLSLRPSLLPSDINECVETPDICGVGGECVNLIGDYQCHCLTGFLSFLGDGNCEGTIWTLTFTNTWIH